MTPPRAARKVLGHSLMAGTVLLAGPALSCLYNDTGTFVESNDRNPSAVRFVEGIPLDAEMLYCHRSSYSSS